jgi:DNA invertase Pin-like site-specific DNA recombinase
VDDINKKVRKTTVFRTIIIAWQTVKGLYLFISYKRDVKGMPERKDGCMKFGYARVSKQEQHIELQIDALRKYGVDEIFEEKISTRKDARPKLQELLGKLRTSDTLVIWRLDRLGRTVKQLLAIAEDFENKGVNFVSLHENLDTTTATGKFTFHLFCSIAQMERDVITERTKAGLEAARSRGRTGGRKSVESKTIEKALKMYLSNEFSIKAILETTGISKTTLYKYIELNDPRKGDKSNGKGG